MTNSIRETLAAFERGGGQRRPQKPGATRRAVAYVRASTTEQELGPEAQEAQIRSYAERYSVEVVALFRDLGVSGGAPLDERPGLAAALDAVQEHGLQVLLVAKRDRLARDSARAAFVERLVERAGAKVESADGVAGGVSPEDKLLRALLDAMAEYERAAIRMRTKSALAAKRRRGERVGQVPYGYRALENGKLAAEPTEQPAIARIMELRAGGMPWAEITAAMNQSGLRPRGQRWHSTTIQRIWRAETARRQGR